MPLIHMSQIDWGPENKDTEDPNHHHIPRYRIYKAFQNDPYLPYFGDCPICKEIAADNLKFCQERDKAKNMNDSRDS